MTFTLEVEFAGLCGYLVHPTTNQIGVVMPDGRKPLDGRPLKGADGDFLVYHVGYLRYDLADTGVMIPEIGREGTPGFEVIHRFNFDEIDFGFPDESLEDINLKLPRLGCFAPTVTPVSGMFSTKPPAELLMRTILNGGSITSEVSDDEWQFSPVLHPAGSVYRDHFAGSATWRRQVDTDELVIHLNGWNHMQKNVIRLHPSRADGVVRLKIANLCAENPLEWPEMFLRMFNGTFDEDFKWFYRLWQDSRGDFSTLLPRGAKLPVPELIPAHGAVQDCTGYTQCWDYLNDQPCPDQRRARA